MVFVGQSILAFGNEEQKRYFLPRIARGDLTCCWLLSEPNAGSDAAAIQLRAEEEGEKPLFKISLAEWSFHRALQAGEIDIVIGTHRLIQPLEREKRSRFQ